MCFIKVSISYKPFPYPGAHRWSVGWRMLKREASAASLLLSTHSLAASSFRDGIKQIVDESRCMFPCGTNHYGIINVFFFINPQHPAQDLRNIFAKFWAAGPQDRCINDICKSTQYFPIVFLASLLLEGTLLKHQPQDIWPP